MLGSMVHAGNTRAVGTSTRAVPVQAIHSRACLNLHHSDIQGTAQKSPWVWKPCQLRVVLQELEQDDVEVVAPRPESKHVDTCKTKAQIWAKGTTERASLFLKKRHL